ncbi:family 16 glycosylhydrolase, partial [Methylobacterium sp. GXS13]|uniref:family 16 glycosylhydrolase n=1 Tax=Methylobacterium sp. GXS13 TaxID=1730094 RepID=UPI000AAD2BE3
GEHETVESLGFDASTTMADYALEWLPDRLRWSVNGRLLREVRARPDKPSPPPPGKPLRSLWSGPGRDLAAPLPRAPRRRRGARGTGAG